MDAKEFKETYPDLAPMVNVRGNRLSMDIDVFNSIVNEFQTVVFELEDKIADENLKREYLELEKTKTDAVVIATLSELLQSRNVKTGDNYSEGEVRILSESGENLVLDKLKKYVNKL